MARIYAPLLNYSYLQILYWPILDIPQLPHFILHGEIFEPPISVYVSFDDNATYVYFTRLRGCSFLFDFQCTGLDKQLSLLKHILTQCLSLLSHVCCLGLTASGHDQLQLDRQDTVSWLGFLRLFNAVEVLNVSGSPRRYCLDIHIARVLGELTGERAAEVLQMLHTFGLNGIDRIECLTPLLKPSIDARQGSGHPVTIR
jgi:hypothetical protein